MVFIIFACKKEKLPELPENNSPIFSIEGTLDGENVSIEAGENNYFMHSEEFEFNNVKQWRGSLKNGTNLFELILSDGIIDVPNSHFDISELDFLSLTEMPNEPLLYLSKNNLTNSDYIEHITWIVNGETHTNQGPLILFEPGQYSICAQTTFIDQTEATICSEVILGYDKNAKGALRFILGQNNTLLAFFDTPEYEIDYVEWFYNDSLISTDQVNLSTEMITNSCHLKGIVHYSNGVVRSRTAYIDKLSPQNYIQDLTTFEDQSSTSWDFKLRLNFSLNGQNYRSIESTTTDTQFEIISMEEFGYNANGEKVLLVNGILNTLIFHEESASEVNANLTFSFALPYK